METVKTPVSDSYQDYLIDYLRKNPQLAAAYLTATLEEENPEPELLQQAMSQVYQALLEPDNPPLNNLLNSAEAKSIYKFVSLLEKLGLKVSIMLH